jgi:preprotein translocase subunit SecG
MYIETFVVNSNDELIRVALFFSRMVTSPSSTSSLTGSHPLSYILVNANQIVDEGALVTLDGSKSSDPNRGRLAFQWMQIAGREVRLTAPNQAITSFAAPSNLRDNMALTFKLTVTNSANLSVSEEVTIIVRHNGCGSRIMRRDNLPYAYTIVLTTLFIAVLILLLYYIYISPASYNIPGGTSSSKPQNGTSSSKPQNGTSSSKPQNGTSSSKPQNDIANLNANSLERTSMIFIIMMIIIGLLLFFNQKKLWEQTKTNQTVASLKELTDEVKSTKRDLIDSNNQLTKTITTLTDEVKSTKRDLIDSNITSYQKPPTPATLTPTVYGDLQEYWKSKP